MAQSSLEPIINMKIDYDHLIDPQKMETPTAALPKIFSEGMPASILDVGCGVGTWLKAASYYGVKDIFGIDGLDISRGQLLIPPEKFACRNLNAPVDLGRRFEVAVCLEVAEHLESSSSKILIETLTRHSDTVVFSAACPGQPGQHHVNCQWPDYWQELFNSVGFICEDTLRYKLWDNPKIEFWYKQNIFVARRDARAGTESRIKAIFTPEMQVILAKLPFSFDHHVIQIENGRMPVGWYLKTPVIALFRKAIRKLFDCDRFGGD